MLEGKNSYLAVKMRCMYLLFRGVGDVWRKLFYNFCAKIRLGGVEEIH